MQGACCICTLARRCVVPACPVGAVLTKRRRGGGGAGRPRALPGAAQAVQGAHLALLAGLVGEEKQPHPSKKPMFGRWVVVASWLLAVELARSRGSPGVLGWLDSGEPRAAETESDAGGQMLAPVPSGAIRELAQLGQQATPIHTSCRVGGLH